MPNVCPKHWGPPTWRALEFMLIGYDPHPSTRPAERCVAFFRDHLGPMLACERCRLNWEKTMAQFPLDPHMHSVASRLQWLRTVRRHVAREKSGSGSGVGDEAEAIYVLLVFIVAALALAGGVAIYQFTR